MDNTQEKIGRVIEVRKNSFVLDCREREIPARLKGSFYDQTTETWPVVGDWVRFLDNPEGDSLILSVCGRKSFLQRLDTAKTGEIQAMAANVDYCFIVTALNGDYSYNRIGVNQIDNIIVTKNILVLNARTIPTKYSDHYPLFAFLKLK